ncbi:ATP-dependent helicase HrpB [Sporomusa termitida]|uniref:ATP-dependent helicase HrpB n=1 Tax=Sporomusa termitida TaxID=2377 RepID=A0A517DRP7_9FIRM|nr:ATP-dependent helicase HrpB [Sporomusa termitida]QDR80022.1 ATP-dependent helicase HrpB [Sporomusa termitida]
MNRLPIEDILPDLKAALTAQASAVLVAPPGSGKTTRIPLALMNEEWLRGQRILMLEPRRLAARAAARYMAQLLGEQVGETVGYRVRLDSCAGPRTRIEVITEGILTRMLQADQALAGVGLIIFDEYHERSLQADLGLALAVEAQAVLRTDLRLLIMSATLAAEAVAELLGGAPVICGSGQAYPVTTHYLEQRREERLEAAVVKAVGRALAAGSGDLLVFLPGAGEIRRVQAGLMRAGIGKYAQVAPLYGGLSLAAQDLAILPSTQGGRKIVLATSIAETSLTVEGVRIVIDSGLMRVPRFSARTGLTRLETVRVSRSSADQRRGRAGRLGPGVCFRLWTRQEDLYLETAATPEILAADLTALALELAAWGVSDPGQLQWLDAPPAAAFLKACELLNRLGAMDNGIITGHGRQIVRSGLHPRLAHMILKAAELGLGGLACELAAILSERDFFSGADIDLRLRVDMIRKLANNKNDTAWLAAQNIDAAVCRRIMQASNQLKQQFGIAADCREDIEACGLVVAMAYPDRIGQQRDNGRFLLENGRGAIIAETQPLAHNAYIVAADLDGQGSDSRIFLAAPVTLEELRCYLAPQIVTETTVAWDESVQAVRAKVGERLGTLILKESPEPEPDPAAVLEALLAGIAGEGLSILPWTKAARQLRQRLLFIHQQEQNWPDVADEGLLATLANWLGPYVYGLTARAQLAQLNLASILEAMLSREQLRELNAYAPAQLTVPSGQRISIDYSNPEQPVLAVKIQEMFGLSETPRIAGGKVCLTLHLLSPAQRIVQVTQDLANFWSKTYFEVKRDLLGRYPKHPWPDEPMKAVPTRRARPKPIKAE